MERAQRKMMFYPARCPGCDDVVHLIVGTSVTVRVQVHSVVGCGVPFYYRCWIEEGFPVPRVEYLARENAMRVTLQPHSGERDSASAEFPAPPELRYPHLMRRSESETLVRRPRTRATQSGARGRSRT